MTSQQTAAQQTIGVIGAGTMGSGIAQVCALAGLSVVMLDMDEKRVAAGATPSRPASSGWSRRRSSPPSSATRRSAALRGATDYGALGDCDLVIEAATEDEALKLKILRQVDAVAKDATRSSPPTPRRSRSPGSPRR